MSAMLSWFSALMLLSGFAVGVLFSGPVKRLFDEFEADLRAEVSSLRTDVSKVLERLKAIDTKLSRK